MLGTFSKHVDQEEKINTDLRNLSEPRHIKTFAQKLYLCEDSLSKELGEMKIKKLREEKTRQLLWETSPELRELRQKFLLANVTRDQTMQIAERQALLELKRMEDLSLAAEEQRKKEAMEAEEKKKEMEEFQAKLKYHKELDELRRFKLVKDSMNESEVEKEKNAIDEILKKIKEEELEVAKRRIEKQKAYYKETEELQKVRNEMRHQEKVSDVAQDMKVDEYRKAQELRAKEQAEKKQLYLEQRIQIQEKLLSYLENMCSEKSRQEILRTELAVEEKDAAEREKELETEKEKMKIREDLHHLYEMQICVKKQKEELQKREDELYRKNLMAKLYEQDKLDLMTQQKRHQKKIEHLHLVKAMIEEDKKRKAIEREKELADLKYQQHLESERAKLVDEEKLKFIKDFASGLLGFLPKGILQNHETVELLGDEFKKFYYRQN